MTINNVTEDPFSLLRKTDSPTQKKEQGALATEDFLSLMTTQLQNQDPLKPLESGDFLGQIASFSTVSGVGELNDSFGSFAQSMQSDQALRGSALVGRQVLIPSDKMNLVSGNSNQGTINVSEPVRDLKLNILDESGVLVSTVSIGSANGETRFTWDGTDDQGQALPSGTYQYQALATAKGKTTAFSVSTVATVDSVVVGKDGKQLTINIAGIGAIPFSQVKEIR